MSAMQRTIHVVRHAHAGSRHEWDREDRFRPLDDHGWIQSKLISETLDLPSGARLLSSPFTRCMQTLEPLAGRHRMVVEAEDLLAEGSPPEPLTALIGGLGSGTVLCSHGDVITNLIGHLAASGAAVDHRQDTRKGARWTLTVVDGRIRAGVYGPPPRV